ncbi:hypothetical protein M3Y99_00524500 [Aphelenchoides fujianensis]|nr:hypothetical protein M3Y99_00524500 [Aphelenchoides fujianensis]
MRSVVFILLTFAPGIVRCGKIKYREAFPPEHDGYLPDAFKQRLREIAANEYLTGEARIDLVDKVYDKLPKSVLVKLPLDPPVYQLPPPTQKKFRALMVDRSLGWRRRAQLYDQLVGSLPRNYRKMMDQYAKTGGKSSSSSSSSSDSSNMSGGDPEMDNAGGGGAEMSGGAGGGGMSGGAGGGGMSGGDGGGSTGMGGEEKIYTTDLDKSAIDYDKLVSSSSEEDGGPRSKGKPWAAKGEISKKAHIG